MGDVADILYRKPMHIITTSLVSIYEDKISREEKITADLPQGVRSLVFSDTSFVFYLDRRKPWDKRLLTTEERETFQVKNEKGEVEIKTRYIFARRKLDLKDETGKPLLEKWEKADLAAVWGKVTGKGKA
jgi:hypothetical protein